MKPDRQKVSARRPSHIAESRDSDISVETARAVLSGLLWKIQFVRRQHGNPTAKLKLSGARAHETVAAKERRKKSSSPLTVHP